MAVVLVGVVQSVQRYRHGVAESREGGAGAAPILVLRYRPDRCHRFSDKKIDSARTKDRLHIEYINI